MSRSFMDINPATRAYSEQDLFNYNNPRAQLYLQTIIFTTDLLLTAFQFVFVIIFMSSCLYSFHFLFHTFAMFLYNVIRVVSFFFFFININVIKFKMSLI